MAWNLDALITLDPAQIGEVNGNDIIFGNVCTPPVNHDPQDISRIVPAAAESWSASPDGLTLKLRADLKFPDGRAATAADAAWSMQRAVLLGYGNSATLTQRGLTKDKVAEQIRATDDRAAARKQRREAAGQARPRMPRLAKLMDDAEAGVLACMGFPAQHRLKLHSTDALERLNGETKRRSDVLGILPSKAAATRLIGALLLERND